MVQRERDLWSVRVVGPRLFLRAGHDSDFYQEGILLRARSNLRGDVPRWGKASKFDGRGGAGVIKAQGKQIERWCSSPDLGSKTPERRKTFGTKIWVIPETFKSRVLVLMFASLIPMSIRGAAWI